ncbi:hypothetical protein HWV62_3685 [Athelia sp. TMB]|nr:hypothetical protein HWV62_3685 [Athelia sp. TMB]
MVNLVLQAAADHSASDALVLSGRDAISCVKAMLAERIERATNVPEASSKDRFKHSLQIPPNEPLLPPAPHNVQTSQIIKPPSPEPQSKAPGPVEIDYRDDGVTDAVWNQLQKDIVDQAAVSQAVQKKLREMEESAIQAAQEEEVQRQLVQQKELERARVKDAAVKDELRRQLEEARIREALAKAQRDRIAAELEARKQEEAMRRKQEAQAQAKLRQMGVCVAGYQWIKQSSGYSMSVRLANLAACADEDSRSQSSSSSEDDQDQSWDDFAEESIAQQPCLSLFDSKQFPSVTEALDYDRKQHQFDLDGTCSRLSLDFHQRIRLINFIRKNQPSSTTIFTGEEPFFTEDEYLKPVVEDDPLLQFQPDDEWSDSDEEAGKAGPPASDLRAANIRIRALEKKLADAKRDLVDYRGFIGERLNLASLSEAIKESDSILRPARDDDSHYFESYGENDIHATMIQDKVRTSTYAQFIMTSPSLFQDAIVLDVGCGTGILSLFAAKSGAKHVFAVDASDIAEKATEIVKANGLDNIITVIRGKVEDIVLPEGITHVDVIISEWMGYALLYESMLDSVLHARDRFLKPDGGVMAPSQCQMMLGLCEGSEIFKERVDFWGDVYGFDLSTMAGGVYDEAVVDVVGPDAIISKPYVIKDLNLGTITPRQLDFSSSFTLVSTAERRTRVHAFILYFDTFFTTTGEPIPDGTQVKIVKEGDIALAEVWPVGNKPAPQRRASLGGRKLSTKITSFSTGPKSTPTHWKQTLFLLREPLVVTEGDVVVGSFHCRKSETNSRELEVEIHYALRESSDAAVGEVTVQMYKVR